jgi:hypothetical protein
MFLCIHLLGSFPENLPQHVFEHSPAQQFFSEHLPEHVFEHSLAQQFS